MELSLNVFGSEFFGSLWISYLLRRWGIYKKYSLGGLCTILMSRMRDGWGYALRDRWGCVDSIAMVHIYTDGIEAFDHVVSVFAW